MTSRVAMLLFAAFLLLGTWIQYPRQLAGAVLIALAGAIFVAVVVALTVFLVKQCDRFFAREELQARRRHMVARGNLRTGRVHVDAKMRVS